VLGHYEHIRALLAGDQAEPVAAAAKDLQQAARDQAASAGAPAKAPYTKVAAAAGRVATAPAKDIEAVRKAFGELSKAVVGLLAADPALAKGQHVFECPMAKGYGKWVQPTDKLENPYMGKKMLACGGPSEMKP
jgi:Cu(I)/Ag(I) efflux system membrane fusion protein